MRIAFAADHAGAVLKDELLRRLAATDAGHELIDLGGDGSDPNDDYPDFAQRLGDAIRDGDADRGHPDLRLRRRRGVAANKMRGIRVGGLPRHVLRAPGRRARRHERADARRAGHRPGAGASSARVAFLGATFSGEPRHRRRLDKVLAMEAAAGDPEA